MVDDLDESPDLAMVIAWPDITARGDEKWMAVLKSLGIVKNLNFKVGHAAIILIQQTTGILSYYDFGRYITPRGFGRARSANSDPRLSLLTRAIVAENGNIINLSAILEELHRKESATHGGGRTFFSIAGGISYSRAAVFADQLVRQGPIPYGAIAKGNNSCSRFVAQTLLAGMANGHPGKKDLVFPESLKPSPMSNVVNATPGRIVYCYHNSTLTVQKISRWQSLQFQAKLLLHNLSSHKSRSLPCDRIPGNIIEPPRPEHLPKTAQWLGGIGEGAWFSLEKDTKTDIYHVVKYASHGIEEYRVTCVAAQMVDLHTPYQFTYHFHHQRYTILQGEQKIALSALSNAV